MTESVAEEVAAIVRRTGLDPQQLIVEITESMIMHDSRAVVPCLGKLRELGVQLAMDDFGTGYSSLAVLHRFPLDVLKIDREFVTRLNASRPYAAIVQAIVTLAHNLGLIVIAEGVEKHEEIMMLQSLDCDLAQGYLFSKPVSASEAESLVEQDLRKCEAAA